MIEVRHSFKVLRRGLGHLDEDDGDNQSTVMTSSSLRDQV